MNTKTLTGFAVAGLSARTRNADELAGFGRIPEIWGHFMQANLAALLTDKVGDEIYAVYFDYESDHTGAYSFLLGYKVSSLTDLPPGITGVEIPDGTYAVVTSAEGPPTQTVPEAWAGIWNDQELEKHRSYRTDFERYNNSSRVEIYLGI